MILPGCETPLDRIVEATEKPSPRGGEMAVGPIVGDELRDDGGTAACGTLLVSRETCGN